MHRSHLNRICLLLALAFLLAPSLRAQTWWPNAAQGDKTATWQQTSAEMLKLLAPAFDQSTDKSVSSYKDSFSISGRCTLQERYFLYNQKQLTANSNMLRIDLSKADPLKVAVSENSTEHTWLVQVSGSTPLITYMPGTQRTAVNPESVQNTSISSSPLLDTKCATGETACTAFQSPPYASWGEVFKDLESAQKFARTAQHAVILCSASASHVARTASK